MTSLEPLSWAGIYDVKRVRSTRADLPAVLDFIGHIHRLDEILSERLVTTMKFDGQTARDRAIESVSTRHHRRSPLTVGQISRNRSVNDFVACAKHGIHDRLSHLNGVISPAHRSFSCCSVDNRGRSA